MKIEIEIDLALCAGHAQCEILAPEYFEVRDDGKAYALREEVNQEDIERMKDVMQRCPTFAIRLKNGDS